MGQLVSLLKVIPGTRYLRQARYARFFKNADNFNLFHGIYDNFEEAKLAAPSNKVIGYDNDQPAEMYDEYMTKVGPSDFPPMFWMQRLSHQVKNIYDFGGHVGVKYYAYSQYLSAGSIEKWTTYDVPAVVARGKKLAKRMNSSIEFSDDVMDIEKGYDLLFASGSFQYLEDPIATIFNGLIQKPRFILINMIPLNPTKSYVTLQNIGAAFCPYKIFCKADLLAQVASLGYHLKAEWENPEKTCIIPFHEELNVIGYSGLLFELN